MNAIMVTTNGPLECRGEIEIVSADGAALATETWTWLCRCGQSSNKPYCDTSHKKAEFRDDSVAPAAPSVAEPGAAGVLRVLLRTNGPLRLDGPCEVRHPTVGLI